MAAAEVRGVSDAGYVHGKAIPRARWSAASIARLGSIVFFGSIAGINLFATIGGEPGWSSLHLLTCLSAIYLLSECVVYLRSSDAYGLLSPAFLATLIHFGLSYLLLPTALVFDHDLASRWAPYLPDMPADFSWTMLVAMGGAFAMWRAYYFVRRAVGPLRNAVARSSFIRTELRPKIKLLLLIQVGYFVLVAYSIRLGVFGFASTPEALAENESILYLLHLGSSAGALALFMLFLELYRQRTCRRSSRGLGLLCLGLVFAHVGTGALSGFKSAMVMPFVAVTMARFIVTRTISRASIIMAMLMLVVAYQVIEPYRAYLSNNYAVRDVASLWRALSNAALLERVIDEHGLSTSAQIAGRVDLLVMSSIGIRYVDEGKLSTEDERMFQDSIVLSPVLAFVPRALWPEKPVSQFGLWYSRQVLGSDNVRTAVAGGPIAFLYMAGGVTAIMAGFFFFGALQALFFDGVARASAGGVIIFLAMADSLVIIPSDVGPVITGMLRMLPIAIVVQYFMLLPPIRSHGRS